jgi:cytoskeletal protein RodZ
MKKAIYSQKSELLRKLLIEKRNSSELSIRDLAEILKIHHSIVGKIETGERQINVIEFMEYCQALEIDPIEIIDRLKKL